MEVINIDLVSKYYEKFISELLIVTYLKEYKDESKTRLKLSSEYVEFISMALKMPLEILESISEGIKDEDDRNEQILSTCFLFFINEILGIPTDILTEETSKLYYDKFNTICVELTYCTN